MADPNVPPPALREVVEEIEAAYDRYAHAGASERDRQARVLADTAAHYWPAMKAALSQPQPQPGAAGGYERKTSERAIQDIETHLSEHRWDTRPHGEQMLASFVLMRADLTRCEAALSAATARLAEVERELSATERERGRLGRICDSAFAYLPITKNAMAYVDHDVTPHVVAVADEFAVLRAQVEAFQRERDALREALTDLDDDVSEPDFEDERLRYVDVQISREMLAKIRERRKARAALAPPPQEPPREGETEGRKP